MVFLCWCGGVFVVVWWCFCGGVVVFLWWCGGVFVVVWRWSHYHRGTAESLCTAKKWFGHGAGRSPCAHSIGKFLLCYILYTFFSSETSAPGSPGNYLYTATPYTAQTFLLFNRLLCFRDIRRLVWFLIGFCD